MIGGPSIRDAELAVQSGVWVKMDTAQLRRHFDEFRTVGWTVLPGFLAPTTVATLCAHPLTVSCTHIHTPPRPGFAELSPPG